MLVDAHAHIFPKVGGAIGTGTTTGLGYGQVAIGSQRIQLMPPLCQQTLHTPEMLLAHMDWAGVDKAVLLQGSFYGECNQYVLETCRDHPDRLIGTMFCDPWAEGAKEIFASQSGHGDFAGVKLECSEATGFCGIHRGARLDDARIAWLWNELERKGMVLVLDLGAVGSASYQTDAIRSLAERHPGLTIVLAHLGQPNRAAEADKAKWRLWEQQIDLGRLPNVSFDTASLPAYVSSEGYPYPSAGRYIRMAIDRIGPTKVMWGTDIPGALAYATYPQMVQAAHIHLQFLSPTEQAMVMGENAIGVFHWKTSP
jgi:predicted TIM-barrel fold metal-dependent hydrolase